MEFGSTVDPEINGKVLALDVALKAAGIAGVRRPMPTYRSLMIHYDPLVVSRAALTEEVRRIRSARTFRHRSRRRMDLPLLFGFENRRINRTDL